MKSPERREGRMPSATPAEVLAQRRDLILNRDIGGFVDLFAPDAVIEGPFTGPPGTPMRLEGREAIREYSRRVMASPLQLEEFEVVELYQTQDPQVVIVEMRTKGTMTTTGRSFVATSIQILRIREGQIVLFRDFADSRVLEDVIREPRPERASATDLS
jgi:ketosteroid isomerase-like protein